MGKKKDYEADLARMYTAYILPGLRKTGEFERTQQVSDPTLESVIASSKMGVQNAYVQKLLKEYAIENKKVLALPVATEHKTALYEAKVTRIAVRRGQLAAQARRGSMVYRALKQERAKLSNYIRLQPFLAALSEQQLGALEGLQGSIRRPKIRRDGILTVEYRQKRKPIDKLLEGIP